MNPFGLLLGELRRRKQYQQLQLAEAVGVSASYLSRLEKGQKAPPSKFLLSAISNTLRLHASERKMLYDAAEASRTNWRMPKEANEYEYTFVNKLWQRLGSLSREEVITMEHLLTINTPKEEMPIDR